MRFCWLRAMPDHPEVQGIVGHTTGKVKVFADLEELEKMLPELLQQESIYVVAQTTFPCGKLGKVQGIFKKTVYKSRNF